MDPSTRLTRLLDRVAQGSGGCLVVERGPRAPVFCDAAADEAERRRIGVRRATGSPHPFGAFETVCELFGLDVESPEAEEVRRHGTGLDALRALAEQVDASAVGGPQLLLVDRAEHVDASSARFFGFLARHLEPRRTALLLVASEVAPRSWLEDVASSSTDGLLRLRTTDSGAEVDAAVERLAGLEESHRHVADALAVLGPGASLAAVAEVSALAADVVLDALEALTAVGTLRRTATGAGHLVVADDVLDAMGPARRAELHRRAAEHGRSIGESAIRSASHLEHVVPGALPWAARAPPGRRGVGAAVGRSTRRGALDAARDRGGPRRGHRRIGGRPRGPGSGAEPGR